LKSADLALLGIACGWGASDRGCQYGPAALEDYWRENLRRYPGTLHWRTRIAAPEKLEGQSRLGVVAGVCRRLAQEIRECVAAGLPFAVVGGDHSCAIGTWSGAREALETRGPLGLLWIDAHMDSHLPGTSPSGALHGMPLAVLLGQGEPRLTEICHAGPALLPTCVSLLGVRSFEPEEAALLARLGVRVFSMEAVQRLGMETALQRALDIVCQDTAGFGISLDLDAIDPQQAPGVGTPVPGGLDGVALRSGIRRASRKPGFLGLEIAEYNPLWDRHAATARLVLDLLQAIAPP
jgi:arginase